MSEPENSRSREGDRMRSFEHIEAALRASGGVISVAAQKLGVHRQRVYEWIEADPKLKAIITEVREEVLDLAEGKLLEHIRDGSEKSIHFYLDRIGRDRGYGSKVGVGGLPGEPPIGVAGTVTVLPDLSGTSQSDRDDLRAVLERVAGRSAGPAGGVSGT